MPKIPLETITSTLEKLYPNPKPPLHYSNDFELLCAVLLSAQSTDKKVNEITPNLFKIANTPEKMNELGRFKIKEIIKQIGLSNTKAKHLELLSKKLVEEFDSKVPHNFDELISLPGVGEKTAQVVMIHGPGNEPAFPVDTHILRVSKRWGISKEKTAPKCSSLMKKLFPKNLWEKLHLQIIFFGREICVARNPKCGECPFERVCPKII